MFKLKKKESIWDKLGNIARVGASLLPGGQTPSQAMRAIDTERTLGPRTQQALAQGTVRIRQPTTRAGMGAVYTPPPQPRIGVTDSILRGVNPVNIGGGILGGIKSGYYSDIGKGIRAGVGRPLVQMGAGALRTVTRDDETFNRAQENLYKRLPEPQTRQGQVAQTASELGSYFAPGTLVSKGLRNAQAIRRLGQGGAIGKAASRVIPEVAGGGVYSLGEVNRRLGRNEEVNVGRELGVGAAIDLATLGVGRAYRQFRPAADKLTGVIQGRLGQLDEATRKPVSTEGRQPTQAPSAPPKVTVREKPYRVASLDEIDTERAMFLRRRGYATAKDSSGRVMNLDTGKMSDQVLDTLNPTGGVVTEYNPKSRITMKLGDNITTLDRTSAKSPDTLVTIYRGAPRGQLKIAPGDYVTTDKNLAKSYSGDGNILETKVPMKDVLDDTSESLGGEYIYRPKTIRVVGSTPEQLADTQRAVQDKYTQRVVEAQKLPPEQKTAAIRAAESERRLAEQNIENITTANKRASEAPVRVVSRPSELPKGGGTVRITKSPTNANNRLTNVEPISETQQQSIKNVAQGGVGTQIRNELGEKILSSNSLFLRQIKEIASKTGRPEMVDQLRFHVGSVARSQQAALGFIKTNGNFSNAVQGLNKRGLKEASRYANARRELANAQQGLKTSRPIEELENIVQQGGQEMAQRFEALNAFYKDLARMAHEAGVIDDARLTQLLADDNYIRIQRNMEDIFNPARGGASKRYSLNTTITGQKRTGSKRETEDAFDTALDYAFRVTNESNRNEAAIFITNALEEAGLAQKVTDATSTTRNLIDRRVNGVVERFEVDPAFKEAAENLSPYHLGILGRVVGFPKRVFAAGTTGLRASFTAANYVKDQVSSGVLSQAVRDTHGIKNIGSGLHQATKSFVGGTNDEMWERFIRVGSDFADVDLRRATPQSRTVIRDVARGRRGATNSLVHPVRTLEDLNKVTEVATRFQNFRGTYNAAKKRGLNDAEAQMEATLAAWNNSVDFAEAGTLSRAMNLIFPYFNPGVQGTRRYARALKEKPLATLGKTAAFVATPVAAATIYNLSDPERKEVYKNIPDYDKESNIIIVPPGTTQNEDGSYDVIKIPLTFQFGDIVQPLRRSIEHAADADPMSFGEVAKDLLQPLAGPLQIGSGAQLLSSVIPQAAKPAIQQSLNKDLFTGRDIVPGFMEDAVDAQGRPVADELKAYDSTSGSIRRIAQAFNTSPLRVEKFVEDTFGRASGQIVNAVDNALAKGGVIPDEQIGGASVLDDFRRRFAKTYGKVNVHRSEGAKYYEKVEKFTSGLTPNEKAAWGSLHPTKKNFLGEQIFEDDNIYDPAARLDIYNRFPKVYEADKNLDRSSREEGKPGNPLFDLQKWQLKKVLEKENLPPGADDPELSNLYAQPWYQDYRNSKTRFFDQLKSQAESEGRSFGSSENPYPETPDDLQQVMDNYSNLPKGTGERSAWIQANPGLWNAMTSQWAKVDNWQNIQRGRRGLAATEGEEGIAGGFKEPFTQFAKGGKGGGRGRKVYVRQPGEVVRGKGLPSPRVKTTTKKVTVRPKSQKGKKAKVTSMKLKV